MKDSDVEISTNAVDSLAQIGDPSAIPALIAESRNKNTTRQMRYTAIAALGRMGGPPSIQALTTIVQDEEISFRQEAVFRLNNLGNATFVPLLQGRLRDHEAEAGMALALAQGRIWSKSRRIVV